MLTRRAILVGGLTLAGCAQGPRASTAFLRRDDDPRFAAIEARIGGRVGVCAIDTATGATIVHRGNERFAMCSSFKWLLAAQHLHMDQENPGWLGEILLFGRGDLIPNSPVASQHAARGYMSNEEMCEAIVVTSDNTCANLLLIPAGGPAGLTRFLRANRDPITRLDRTEPALNENLPGDARDTTSPRAMARTVQRLLLGDDVLDAVHRDKLIGWMAACETGRARLRAGLPSEWRAGDKTGTSDEFHNATNDVAIAWPPGRAPIIIACYLSDSIVDMAARNAAHAEIARIVAESWS
jgi:beta-lactamase class A